jgi:nicotinamidase/pyrazinamidase
MKTVFVDVDTQIDFVYPAGALYVPGAEKIVPVVGKLNRYAAQHGIPQISTMDAHSEDDVEFKIWPHHCVVGTAAQAKPLETVNGASPIVVEKQTIDVFSSSFPKVIEQLQADRYVVYGVVTEICVKSAAFGLLKTGKPVEIVTDAIQSLDAAAGEQTLAEFHALGGKLTTLQELGV